MNENERKLRLCLLALYDSFRLSKITHLAVDRRWTHGPALKRLTYSHAISGSVTTFRKREPGKAVKVPYAFIELYFTPIPPKTTIFPYSH